MHVGRVRKRINIENKDSFLNVPTQNVYGRQELKYSRCLRKEKKKFPLIAYGCNETSPDYLKVSNLYNREKHQNFDPNLFPKVTYLNPGENYATKSCDFNGNRRCYEVGPNSETKIFLDNPINRRIYEFAPKPRSFNILSNREVKPIPLSEKTNNYFSNLIELNMFIRKSDKIADELKQKRIYRYSDRVHEYLGENGFV